MQQIPKVLVNKNFSNAKTHKNTKSNGGHKHPYRQVNSNIHNGVNFNTEQSQYHQKSNQPNIMFAMKP